MIENGNLTMEGSRPSPYRETLMLRTILVPLDGSALAERAIPVACQLARRTGGAVHLARAHVPIAVVGATA